MFETSFTIKGSGRSVLVVVVIVPVSSVVVPVVSGLLIAVPEVSVVVLTVSELM